MKRSNLYIILFSLLIGLFAVQSAMAALGSVSEKKEKFSLKSLNKLSKTYSLTSLQISDNFQFQGFEEYTTSTNNGEVSIMMKMEKGNTTYVFPYKYKGPVTTKFKTPAAPTFR